MLELCGTMLAETMLERCWNNAGMMLEDAGMMLGAMLERCFNDAGTMPLERCCWKDGSGRMLLECCLNIVHALFQHHCSIVPPMWLQWLQHRPSNAPT